MVEQKLWSHLVAGFQERGIHFGFHRRRSALSLTHLGLPPRQEGLRCLCDICQPRDNSLVWDGSLSATPSCLYPSYFLSCVPGLCLPPRFEVLVRTDWGWSRALLMSFPFNSLQIQAHRLHSFVRVSPGLCQKL